MHLVKPDQGWSKSALASEFGLARQTIEKILRTTSVQSYDKVSGHPVWRMRDVAPAIVDYLRGQEGSTTHDPELMKPKERLDWFNSERQRLQFEQETGELIPNSEVSELLEYVFDGVKTFVVTLPDILERDVGGLSAEHVQKCIDTGDKQLGIFADKLQQDSEANV